jgi:hypothetical protein
MALAIRVDRGVPLHATLVVQVTPWAERTRAQKLTSRGLSARFLLVAWWQGVRGMRWERRALLIRGIHREEV